MLKKRHVFAAAPAVALVLASATASAATIVLKSASRADSFGGSRFGAAYSLGAAITANNDTGVTVFNGNGDLSGSVTIFGSTRQILSAQAGAQMVLNQSASGSANIYVMGSQVYSKSLSIPVAAGQTVNVLSDSKSFQTTFFNNSQRFWVGPVPVKVTVSAAGKAGLDYALTASGESLGCMINPSGEAFGSASAGVDIWVASAGVSINLTFLRAGVPSSGSLVFVGGAEPRIDYGLDSDLNLSTLGGSVDLWGKLGWGKKHYLNLFSWSGLSTTIPLIHEHGSVHG